MNDDPEIGKKKKQSRASDSENQNHCQQILWVGSRNSVTRLGSGPGFSRMWVTGKNMAGPQSEGR